MQSQPPEFFRHDWCSLRLEGGGLLRVIHPMASGNCSRLRRPISVHEKEGLAGELGFTPARSQFPEIRGFPVGKLSCGSIVEARQGMRRVALLLKV
jgi:hypothetical protein